VTYVGSELARDSEVNIASKLASYILHGDG
jgi:hypothetical protein